MLRASPRPVKPGRLRNRGSVSVLHYSQRVSRSSLVAAFLQEPIQGFRGSG